MTAPDLYAGHAPKGNGFTYCGMSVDNVCLTNLPDCPECKEAIAEPSPSTQPASTGAAKYRTPTPWRKALGCRIVGANHGIDGVSREVVAYEVICDQDADLIVQAVNSYAPLASVLDAVETWLNARAMGHAGNELIDLAIAAKKGRAALKAATGGENGG